MKLKEFKDALEDLIEKAKGQSSLEDIASALEDAKDDVESEAAEAEEDSEEKDSE
jgi:hypothetical protein